MKSALLASLTLAVMAVAITASCASPSGQPDEARDDKPVSGQIRNSAADEEPESASEDTSQDSSSEAPRRTTSGEIVDHSYDADASDAGITDIGFGDTFPSRNAEVFVESGDFAYRVQSPGTSSGFYTYYDADSGCVYYDLCVTVTNNDKNDLPCSRVMTVKAYYDDGYTYDSFSIADDDNGTFVSSNARSIAPLAQKSMHWLISLPEEAASNGKPLVLILKPYKSNDIYRLTVQ